MAAFGLLKLLPLALAVNALFFEPPSAKRSSSVRRTNQLEKRVPTAPGPNFVKRGCFVDTVHPRSLEALGITSDSMTNAYCQSFCDSRGYSFAGTEFGRECFCDNSLNNSLLTDDEGCNMTCTGAAETCGGPGRLTVYQNQGTVSDPGRLTYGDWKGQGCYSDNVSNRALPVRMGVEGAMTIEKCTAKCFASGYKHSGVEYSSECYCANDLVTDGSTTGFLVWDGCTMACDGNLLQTCGGPDRINVYTYTGTLATLPTAPVQKDPVGDFTLKGCYTDSANHRTLPIEASVDGGMTAEKCTAKCYSMGYQYAGLEFAKECYCSQAIGTVEGSGILSPNGCTMSCEGDSSEVCGGADRITIYQYSGSGPSGPTELASYNDFNSKGCFVDSRSERALTSMPTTQRPMTVSNCVDACKSAGYVVAGVEYSTECYCGFSLPLTAATDGCVMPCEGDATHICGGPDRLSIYEKAGAITEYRIKAVKAADNSEIGFVSRANNAYSLPKYTNDADGALRVEIKGPKTTTFGTCNDLRETNPLDENYPYFGNMDIGSLYTEFNSVAQTPPGASPTPAGANGWLAMTVESCQWTIDQGTLKLSQTWVQSNGDPAPGTQYLLNSGNYAYFVAAVDSATFDFYFPEATRVNFYLDPVI